MIHGYTQIYTGNGKGKTTAALGLALRAVGAGLKVYFGQFIKSAEYNEIKALARFGDRITVAQYGRGCFIRGAPCDADIDMACSGLRALFDALTSEAYDLVIADEANVAFGYGLISEADLLALMDARPAAVELVLTGRGAPLAVVARADLVTEMQEIKHYYQQGVLARDGIEK
jgi:cob(I)alamin adenosyltransferase